MSGPVDSSSENWLEDLSRLADESARRKLFDAQPLDPTLADRLYAQVVQLTRVDLLRTERVAQALTWLAAKTRDPYADALSLRARGHFLALTGNYEAAVEKHQATLGRFEELGRETDAARALMNLLQPLIYLGQYERAYGAAERARAIFEKQGDALRLARLDSNVANILYRQDRFSEALNYYQRAYEYLVRHGDTQDVAIVLRNMAVCFISLNRFEEALRTYRDARDYCQQNGLELLVAECDYNIAYLHYLRGEYTRAISLYQATRALCEQLADRYHTALCDLDLSELYLELNLSEEGFELASRAQSGFEQLSMGYEAAKAVTFQAIAASQQGKSSLALRQFARARSLFAKERNALWPALIHLYEALVLEETGDLDKARRLTGLALRYFKDSPSLTKTALCHLLLARLDLKDSRIRSARQHYRSALELLKNAESPSADFQAEVVLAQIEEKSNSPAAAYQAFDRAHALLEAMRSRLLGEELKISFLKDKLQVYESLVWLALNGASREGKSEELAFHYMERAKSRSLADLISFNLHGLPARTEQGRGLGNQVEDLRLRLTLAYRQVQQEEMLAGTDSAEKILTLRRKSRDYEGQIEGFASRLRSLDDDFATLLNAGTASVAEIQSSLPADSVILEYFVARGQIHACVVSRNRVQIIPVASVNQTRDTFRLLQFQLSKFRLGNEYLERFSVPLRNAVESHLRELYSRLIAPVRPWLQAAHLTIVPHGFLHYLPFPALMSESGCLMDDFTISFAPSASVFALCAARPNATQQESLVFGIPDPLAPEIGKEASTVASILPNARLVLGEDATQEFLWEHAPNSRYIHIATHGLFRQDNPMFSSIRLGRSELNLYDIYRLRLSSDLVTLSGCGTGLNVVVGGDELLGLVRGLLYAGTSAVLVTLWDVNDATTAQFMASFYSALSGGSSKAAALRSAMLHVRKEHPHPYYWAPFVLIGKYS
jgi:CHAT domain-containing protein/tetratricopeptide (TPR) repeat protein